MDRYCNFPDSGNVLKLRDIPLHFTWGPLNIFSFCPDNIPAGTPLLPLNPFVKGLLVYAFFIFTGYAKQLFQYLIC